MTRNRINTETGTNKTTWNKILQEQEPAYLLQSQFARLGKVGQVNWTPLSLARPPLRTPLSLSRTPVTLVFQGA